MKWTWVVAVAAIPFMSVMAEDDGMAAEQAALMGKAGKTEEAVELRNTKITADHMEYNYKEAVAVMTDNVVVDDARFSLTADKVFVFMTKKQTDAPKAEGDGDKAELDGTGLEQLVVIGHVVVKDKDKRAQCDKAVYTKADEKLVMVGNASLVSIDEHGKESSVKGDKITIWLAEERMEVYPRPTLEFSAGATKGLKGMMP